MGWDDGTTVKPMLPVVVARVIVELAEDDDLAAPAAVKEKLMPRLVPTAPADDCLKTVEKVILVAPTGAGAEGAEGAAGLLPAIDARRGWVGCAGSVG